ncbi:related to ERAD-associated E3 ubiquitin-protein ligase HRD1 [Nakaseomyces glabratus]|nr:related to ERAD-associated E3 ubiquitin-protein ligase HRD1 [Nakaseomyces glabratus]SLM15620.1 related to ERAD-associated E3 ubiquitin-protein ligase HRD1 [Nakaseomyces glabratus]
MLTAIHKREFLIFTAITYVLTIYCVISACQSSVSFLQIALKLSEGFNILIITVFTLLNSTLLWQFLTSMLFGELRIIEHEHIFERLPFAVINTIFMFSTFNEKYFFTLATCALVLLYMKVFHWILRDRLDLLLQGINEDTRWKDLLVNRYICNLLLLVVIDSYVISFCVSTAYNIASSIFTAGTNSIVLGGGSPLTQRALIYIMQAMEFTNLMIDLVNLILNTGLQFYEFHLSRKFSQNNPAFNSISAEDADTESEDGDSQFNGLEGKFMYEKLIDVVTRFLQTLVHVVMAMVLNLPLMLVKDIFVDVWVLYMNSKSLLAIWKNSKQLDTKLPTMTSDDLNNDPNFDNVCIVCMDELVSENPHHHQSDGKKPKKLPCGHVLHLSCLKNWMERSQTCPICRLPVFDENGEILAPSSANVSQTNLHPGENPDQRDEADDELEDDTSIADLPITDNISAIPLTSDYPFSIRNVGQEVCKELGGTSEEMTHDVDEEILEFEIEDSTTGRALPARMTIKKRSHTNKVSVPSESIIASHPEQDNNEKMHNM